MKNTKNKLNDLIIKQQQYSNIFYNSNELDEKNKLEILKSLCLSLHNEVSLISNSIDYKTITKNNIKLDEDNLIYHTVDSLRYIFAILNLYNINAEEFEKSYLEKDIALNIEANIKEPNTNDKIVIVDIDDVLCEFKDHFNNWLEKQYNIKIDKNSDSYYTTKELIEISVNPESAFELYIKSNQLLEIGVMQHAKSMLQTLKDKGYYIYLLTSRPKNNARCKYQTYSWLKNNEILFDNIDFAPEKYLWLSKQDFYINNQIHFAIDDSAKHAMEYATHGLKCYVPLAPHNKNLNHSLIEHFNIENYNIVF